MGKIGGWVPKEGSPLIINSSAKQITLSMTRKTVDLSAHLASFVEGSIPLGDSFVVAFSGGPDSCALLYALSTACKGRFPQIVHIDHGWREESEREVEIVRKQVEALDLPFRSFRLPPFSGKHNLEEWSRQARLKLLVEEAKRGGASSIMFAHHADDQIEVVLKRFLEGASLRNFRGMRSVEYRDDVKLLRPFLVFRKEELLEWLYKRNISFLEDPTNKDQKFLRARFRETLLPFLRQTFGKEFEASLLRISEESLLLDEWVRSSADCQFLIEEAFGFAWASAAAPLQPSRFLLYHVIDELRKKCHLPALSRSALENIASVFLEEKQGSRRFPLGRGLLIAEHGFIIAAEEAPKPIESQVCSDFEGALKLGRWDIRWRRGVVGETIPFCWKDLLQGKEGVLSVPKGGFEIDRLSDRLLKTRSVLRYGESLASLRPFFPVITQEGILVADFLSGVSSPMQKGEECVEIRVMLDGFSTFSS